MELWELAEGTRVENEPGTSTGIISRVSRDVTLFRHRPVIRMFWIKWDHDGGREAPMLPGDVKYLRVLDDQAA